MSEIRLIDANSLKYKNLAEVNGRLTYVLSRLDGFEQYVEDKRSEASS